jgi:ABC-type phosphate/phosphonate transport system substrate-binding protein
MMKKLLTLFLALVLAFSLAACGKDSDSDDSGGGDVSPTNSSASSEKNEYDGEWDNNPLTKYLPDPTMATLNKVTRNEEHIFIVLVTWTREEAKAYAQACINAGFDISPSESEGEKTYSFVAYAMKDNLSLEVILKHTPGTGSAICIKDEEGRKQ